MTAPSLVQVSPLQMYSSVFPATTNFTLSGCTPGNMIVALLCSSDNALEAFPTFSTWQRIAIGPASPASSRYMTSAIFILPNNQTVNLSVPWYLSSGTESGAYGILAEFTVPNQTYYIDSSVVTNGGQNVGNISGKTLFQPYSALTAGPNISTPELALVSYGWDDFGTNPIGLAIAPPWTTLGSLQDSVDYSGFIGGYQVLTGQSRVTAQLSTPAGSPFTDAPGWSGCMASIYWAPTVNTPSVTNYNIQRPGFGTPIPHTFSNTNTQHFRIRS